MKVVDPEGSAGGGSRTRTFTQSLLLLAPSKHDYVDAAFLAGLLLIALVGFVTSFDSPRFMLVAAVGIVLGIAGAHLAVALRWHWLSTIVLATVLFFGLGGALALRVDVIAGFLPSPATLLDLGRLGITGWKDLLTTLPPVDGSGQLLVLPYLLAVFAATLGFTVARRSRHDHAAVVVPLATLALVILLGTLQVPAVLLQGIGFAVAGFAWVVVRGRRRGHLVATGSSPTSQLVNSAVVVVLAVVIGTLGSGFLPGVGANPRQVLRSYVEPPVDVTPYASPLLGFRKFSSEPLKLVYDQNLLTVTGARPGTLVRFAVMDDYSGTAWSASGAGDASPASGFQRVGSDIPGVPAGSAVTVTITVEPAYAALQDLNAWIPSLGPATRTEFAGTTARSHAGTFRYNLTTGQGIVPDRLSAGDVVTVTSVPLPVKPAADLVPSGSVVVSPERFAFVTPHVQKYAAAQTTPARQLAAVAATLKAGAWSDGTFTGETEYLPGHYQGRLQRFLAGKQLVGSDEHYAATFALMASRIGFPARVVLGAVTPTDGVVKGKDVVAWVELQTDAGWVTVDRTAYIPDRTKHPDDNPPDPVSNSQALDVPPPNPAQPPANLDTLFDTDPAAKRSRADDETPAPGSQAWLVAIVLSAVAPVALVLAVCGSILGAKGWRRARRQVRGTTVDRVSAGWDEIVDLAHDMGVTFVPGSTRQEQARLLGRHDVREVAVLADRAVFGAGQPPAEAVPAMWQAVLATSRAMLGARGLRHQVGARLSLRSLLPGSTWTAARRPASAAGPKARRPVRWGRKAAA